MNYFNNCTTLDEAKKAFKRACFFCHPDQGGSHEAFLDLQAQFESFKAKEEQPADKYFKASDFMRIIEQLIKIEGIEIEICGSWIWITSEKHHKEQIKAVELPENWVCKWAAKKMKWTIHEPYKKWRKSELTMNEIRNLYGSEIPEKEKTKQIA